MCRQLAERRYQVVLTARSAPAGEQAAAEIDRPGSVWPCPLDVTDDTGVAAAVRAVTEGCGRVDVLVNNAAIDYDSDDRAVDVDLGRVARALQTTCSAHGGFTQAFLPLLSSSQRPRIVNVSSEAGSISHLSGGVPAYAVSKAALNALTRLPAGEPNEDRVLVNEVCPGRTNIDMDRGGRPVTDGAAKVVWAATVPDDRPTGGFVATEQPAW